MIIDSYSCELHGYTVNFHEGETGHFWRADSLHPDAITEGLNSGGPFDTFKQAYSDAEGAMDDAKWIAIHAARKQTNCTPRIAAL